ncbi:MAG: hypothetical protein P8123_00565 [bacterium]
MNNADQPRKPSDILRDLHNIIFDVSPEDIQSSSHEEIMADLAGAGIDSKKCINDFRKRLHALKGQLALEEASRKRAGLEEKLRGCQERLKAYSAPIREQVMILIRDLATRRPTEAAVYFRRFEEACDEDIGRIVEDLKCLEYLDEQDGSNES